MEVIYKHHIVRQKKIEKYHPDDTKEVNTKIGQLPKEYHEHFCFYKDEYISQTHYGEEYLRKLYSQYQKMTFYEFSFSNGEHKTYVEGSFSIE